MATINAAIKNLSKGEKVTRKAYKAGTHLKMINDDIIRVLPNTKESTARLPGVDLLASDWVVYKD